MLVVVSGLPGTGKSVAADALARRLGAVQVSVDPIEEALLRSGLPASWEVGVAAYEAAAAVARQNLAQGVPVVVDAVNDSEAARNVWRAAAASSGSEIRFVLLELDDADEHRRRLEGRPTPLVHVPSPTWDDVRARAASYEPWAEGACLRVDATAAVEDVVEAVVARLPSR